MAWAAVAISAGSAVAGIAGGIQAGKQADKAEARAFELTQQAVDFQKEQFQAWEDIYGPIQDNLSNFFQNLTGDSLIASGLQKVEQQFQETQRVLQRSFAQRGVDSAAQDFLTQQADLTKAGQEARLRNDAPIVAAQAKQGFLAQNVTNPNTPGVVNAIENQARIFTNQASDFRQQSTAGFQAASTALTSGAQAFASRPLTPTSLPGTSQFPQTAPPGTIIA